MTRTIVIALLLAACAPSSTPSTPTEPWQRASLDAVPTDGDWRWFYPDEKHVLAEGRIAGGVRTGTWRFYYRDGKRFSQGSYDAKGGRAGAWLLWKPNGELSFEQNEIRCDGFVMAAVPAGSSDFGWSNLPSDLCHAVGEILDIDFATWNGTGFYVEDAYERLLTDEELRAALEAAAGA